MKELQDINSQHFEVQKKVDVVATDLNKLLNDSQSHAPLIEAKQKENKEQFDKLIQLVTELKTLVSQTSHQSILTSEFLTLKVNTLEQAIQKALAPITSFTSVTKECPTCFHRGARGREKRK